MAGGERPAPLELAGIALAAIGVIVVSRSLGERLPAWQGVGVLAALSGAALIAAG